MSEDICGQRFKGVENFLRRIAFNLGNTPSQTEVKVVSCIPIDVTDLQHKITILEQQLEAANKKEDKREDKKESTIHPAICSKTYLFKTPSYKNIGCYCCPSSVSQNEPTCPINTNQTSADLPQYCQPNSSTDKSDMNSKDKCKPDACRRNIFTRKKKIIRKRKVNTQMVYYAQTENVNPFCNNLRDEGTSKDGYRRDSNIFNRHYMTNIVRKQYAPYPINEGIDVSEYSTPVCRDIPSKVEETLQRPQRSCEPDLCSCCCGQFKNIDNKISEHNRYDIFSLRTDSRSAYYDSNFYDVVPVKESTIKTKREYPKRKEFRNKIDVLYWPETIRPNYKTPQIIYQSIAPPRIRKVLMKPQNRKDITVLNKRAKINPALYKKNPRVKTQVKAWTDSFEFSNIYAKQSNNEKHKILKHQYATTDAACLTIPITNTECQIASDTNRNEIRKDITITPSTPECKTEVTLNQIKNILQTVLHEVKTNSNKSQAPIQTKKDAIVQNGPSQSYINQGSSLIKSFTYSPYNMTPYSGASCSKQMPNNNFWDANIPQLPVKCLHYPLFIQPEKNMCTSCYRNYPQAKVPHMKYATSTATNTEVRTRSKETENLIKEIYKSLALHVNMPTKDTIVSRDDVKESICNFNTKVEKREAKHVAKAISEIFKNQKPLDISSVTQTLTPLDSKPVSNKCSTKSQPLKNYRFSAKKESVDYYTNDVVSEAVDKTETEQMSQQLESDDNYDDDDEEEDATHHQNEESESSAISETESDDVVVKIQEPEAQKKKTTGFFSKMLKVFQPRSRNRNQRKFTKEEKELPPTDTDSDDYQTVYSRGTSPSRHTIKPNQCKGHSKVIYYSKLPRNLKEKTLKSRYMEQERGYVNEKLTFRDKPKRKWTKNTASQKISPYYQRVEARNAFVGNSGSIYRTMQNQTRINETSRNKETQGFNQNQTRINQTSRNEETQGFHFHVPVRELKVAPNALSWMKKHKPGLKCAPAWKKLILEG